MYYQCLVQQQRSEWIHFVVLLTLISLHTTGHYTCCGVLYSTSDAPHGHQYALPFAVADTSENCTEHCNNFCWSACFRTYSKPSLGTSALTGRGTRGKIAINDWWLAGGCSYKLHPSEPDLPFQGNTGLTSRLIDGLRRLWLRVLVHGNVHSICV